MIQKEPAKTILYSVILILIVVGLSILSNRIWGDKPEKLPMPDALVIERGMTVAQFGQVNKVPKPALKKIFNLTSESDLNKNISEYGTAERITSLVTKKRALYAEEASKNWYKIVVKFILWFGFLLATFISLKKREVTSRRRKWLLFTSLCIFGIIMGADPSPMGTVKDALYLFGTAHAIFPPRMIALFIFLFIVFLANKYICAWGCQAGTLQDLIFRINHTQRHKPIIGRKIKLPFIVTNSIRILFLLLFILIVFFQGTDIIEPIDIFKIYKPTHFGLLGGIFVGTLLLISLFIYRPWCHLICPFGLAGWIIEKISLVRIHVNYTTCIACKKCADACPSTVMSAILLRNKKAIPDCFACYTCRDVCPTSSIHFSAGKRTKPPVGHFEKGK